METYNVVDKIEIETANDVPEKVWLFSGPYEFGFTAEDFYEIQKNLRDGQTDFYVSSGDWELMDSCIDEFQHSLCSWEILDAGYMVQLLDSGVVRIEYELNAEGYCENEWGEQIGEPELDGYNEGFEIPYDLFMSIQL